MRDEVEKSVEALRTGVRIRQFRLKVEDGWGTGLVNYPQRYFG